MVSIAMGNSKSNIIVLAQLEQDGNYVPIASFKGPITDSKRLVQRTGGTSLLNYVSKDDCKPVGETISETAKLIRRGYFTSILFSIFLLVSVELSAVDSVTEDTICRYCAGVFSSVDALANHLGECRTAMKAPGNLDFLCRHPIRENR